MEAVIIYASSIHGCRRTFRTASLCQATFTFSLSAFASYICVSLCVRVTICIVPLTSSYLLCSSQTFVSKHSTFGSSCRVVRTSNDYSNSHVQFATALLSATIDVVTTVACYSLTSNRVEGWSLNCNSVICKFRSSWILAIFVQASHIPMANLQTHASTSSSV